MNKQITTLYEHFKNAPERLKIICDWDEVIQACEPYALWEATHKKAFENWTDTKLWEATKTFPEYFFSYWFANSPPIEYSLYGSKNKVHKSLLDNPIYKERMEEQANYKNSPFFYQLAPFLTIAEDLSELIKKDKVEQIIFLSAYDKRKFPNGDPRKREIFSKTFGRFPCFSLQLIGFDSEQKGASKADWIKQNASNYDVVIDDNPNICKSVIENTHMTVLAPYYPAIKHDERVLLVKQEVSELKKESFR